MKSLLPVPHIAFHASVKPYLSKAARCSKQPQWLTDAISNGVDLSLDRVLLQAGRHFRDAFDLSIIADGTKRQRASMDLAWMLISMLRPSAQSGLLVLNPHPDSDMRRWAIEVLGVGAGLEMLRMAGAIDARTLRKNKGTSATFDFHARTKAKRTLAQIELKGTVDDASRANHQKSIREKMTKLSGSLANAVSFDDGIGVIFFGWSSALGRFADFQIADPEGTQPGDDASTDRDLLLFYADVYELAGLLLGAESLRNAATSARAPEEFSQEELRTYFGASNATVSKFSRIAQDFVLEGVTHRYGGTAFDAPQYPLSLGASVNTPNTSEFSSLFVGVHDVVIELLRQGDFNRLRSVTFPERSYWFEQRVPPGVISVHGQLAQVFRGFVSLLADGTAYVWSNFAPGDNLPLSDR